jgi:hypothetical protein
MTTEAQTITTSEIPAIAVGDAASSQTDEAQKEAAEESDQKTKEAKDSNGKDDEKFSHKFTILQRREREIQRKEAELKERERKIQEDKDYRAYIEAKNSRNPIAALQALGMTYEDATKFVLNDERLTPEQQIKALQETIEELKKDLTGYKKSKEDEEYQAIIRAAKNEIHSLVDSRPDDFEFIRANNAYDEVWEVIEEFHRQTGQILPYETAAKQVEDFLEKDAAKLLTLKKLSSKLAPQKVETQDAKTTHHQRQTLTNSMVSAAPNVRNPAEQRYMTDEESKAAAADFLRRALATQN